MFSQLKKKKHIQGSLAVEVNPTPIYINSALSLASGKVPGSATALQKELGPRAGETGSRKKDEGWRDGGPEGQD